MKKSGLFCFTLVLVHLLPTVTFGAEEAPSMDTLTLGLPFRDYAILQRGTNVPIWGRSKPGATITVEFIPVVKSGLTRQKKTTVAGKNGNWMLKLDSLKASSEPAELIVQEANQRVVLKDILVGEVWHASGQSNMEWLAGKSLCSGLARELAGSQTEVPIRELRTDTVSALYLQDKGTSEQGWKRSRAAAGFSALSLAFAHKLHQELKVPVGILLTSHSNTRIEAFTQRQAIEAHSKLKGDAKLILDADVTTEQGQAAFNQYYRELEHWQLDSAKHGFPLERPLTRPNLPGIASMWRGPSQFFNGKIAPVIPYAIRGSIWCQGTSNSGDGRIYAARMEALVNGWRTAWDMPDMPFYFTQMQCYGSADPDNVGFADIRQAQHLFFINNRKNAGMVVQTDLNPANPSAIHYQNKLHPGMRLARWALAKEYGREIVCTGPIYKGCQVEGDKVIVSFEQESLSGGLMVGSKGQEKYNRTPGQYVEPAHAAPDEKLNHFRLCGADKKWHAAQAVIEGDTVVVRSPSVPQPVGVQYAYSSAPLNSNLYNRAGLPATPFAVINGKFIFEEDDMEKVAALKAKYARFTDPDYPILQVVEYFRDGAVIQRNQPIPIWGHANKGVKVTVTLGNLTKTVVANDQQQWTVTFPPRKASNKPIKLTVTSSHGHSRSVQDILVGDVWFLTGSPLLSTERAYSSRNKNAEPPAAMPLVREFKRKTAASWFSTPRKRKFETGGGRYRSHWLTADWSKEGHGVTMFAYHFAKALDRPDIPQGFITMSSGQGGRATFMASPLSWTSYQGVKTLSSPAFRARLEALQLQNPASEIARTTTAKYVESVKNCAQSIETEAKQGTSMSAAPLAFPAFPQASEVIDVKPDMIPTYVYNWCVSPFTPMSVSGVIWVPGQYNIGHVPVDYAAELEAYAKSLPGTYGQNRVKFYYAQPAGSLVEGITVPSIPGAKLVAFDNWPKSLKELGTQLGQLAK